MEMASSAVLIALVGLLAYSNTFSVPFHLDDVHTICETKVLADPWDAARIYRNQPNRLVSRLTLAANLIVHGRTPFGFHVVNTAIHIGAALLVWWLANLLLTSPAMAGRLETLYRRPLALFAGLIFVAHPLQVQAVTYIVQRDASLAALFYLLSVCCYLKMREGMRRGRGPNRWGAWYLLALLSGLLGMFTKEICATLPAALLLCEVCFYRHDMKRSWVYTIPFLFVVASLPLALVLRRTTVHELASPAVVKETIQRVDQVTRATQGLSRYTYLITQFRVLVRYMRMVVLPFGQNVDHHVLLSRSLWRPTTFSAACFITLIVGGALGLLKQRPLWAFGVLWFFLALSVESSVVPLTDLMFEHRLYLPMAGFAILLPSLALHLLAPRKPA